MGIFSYYKAFRANTIIINAIEKYEGFNCASQEEASLKLSSIGYNTPFKVKCKSNWGTPCVTDGNDNYAVISYNLDMPEDYTTASEETVINDVMDSYIYSCETNNDCNSTKRYQYGVYTYMYVDLPIISSIAKIPFYSKTRELYEFRDLVKGETPDGNIAYDINSIPQLYIEQDTEGNKFYNEELGNVILKYFNLRYNTGLADDEVFEVLESEQKIDYSFLTDYENIREKFKVFYGNVDNNFKLTASTSSTILSGNKLVCGKKIDYSIY